MYSPRYWGGVRYLDLTLQSDYVSMYFRKNFCIINTWEHSIKILGIFLTPYNPHVIGWGTIFSFGTIIGQQLDEFSAYVQEEHVGKYNHFWSALVTHIHLSRFLGGVQFLDSVL